MIETKCDQCGKVYQLKDEFAGQKGACSCGAVLAIPAAPSRSLAPELPDAPVEQLTCPHCGLQTNAQGRFCEACGKAISTSGAGPVICAPGATAGMGKLDRISAKADYHIHAKKAFGTLIAVAVIQFIATVILYNMAKSNGVLDHEGVIPALVVVAGLGVVFLGLAFWARRAPLPASIIALILYVTAHIIDAIADPATIVNGIIIKVIIIVALSKAIQAGITYRQIQAEDQQQ